MKTYQDYLALGDNSKAQMSFWYNLMIEYQSSDDYKIAKKATDYYNGENPDIRALEKWIYDMQGKAHLDTYNPNHKIRNGYYPLIVDETVSHVISNGISFENAKIKDRLGEMFDDVIMDIVTDAKNCAIGYGFWAVDKLIKIPALEFAPCYDEYTGELAAGVRFYQIDSGKPITMTVYEADGYTVYIKDDKGMRVKQEKTKYKQNALKNAVEGVYADLSENYAALPIIPLYNLKKRSAIVGNLEILIAIDMINSSLVNSVSQGELIYWVLKNYAGMDEIDDANFLIRFIRTHMVHVDGDGEATPHEITPPFEANDAAAARLKDMLFENMRGVNVQQLSAGNLTATYIEAAYTRLREASAKMESEIRKFVYKLFAIVGIPETEKFTFQYNEVINVSESVDNLIKCGAYIDDEHMTKYLTQVLGKIDDYEDIQKNKLAAEMSRMMIETKTETETETAEENEEETA